MAVSGDMSVSEPDGGIGSSGAGPGKAVFGRKRAGQDKDAPGLLLLVLSDPSAGIMGNIHRSLLNMKWTGSFRRISK